MLLSARLLPSSPRGLAPRPRRAAAAAPTAPRRPARPARRVAVATFSPGAGAALTPELKSALDDFLSSNRIVLFMKGTREFPQCGFSNTAVGILNALGAPYETVNILEDDKLRTGMKEYSAWPTFPQLYVGGEFVGGCDIMIQTYQDGSLVETIESALAG